MIVDDVIVDLRTTHESVAVLTLEKTEEAGVLEFEQSDETVVGNEECLEFKEREVLCKTT